MAHPYHHALSSVRKWGGTVEDYLPIHSWFDASKQITELVMLTNDENFLGRTYFSFRICVNGQE